MNTKRCACLCGCDYKLEGYEKEENICGACWEKIDKDTKCERICLGCGDPLLDNQSIVDNRHSACI